MESVGIRDDSDGIHRHSPTLNFRTSLSVHIFIFYRFTCSFEVQVDPLACFLIVLFHILLPKAQERVHADIQAAIRLLEGRRDKTEGRW